MMIGIDASKNPAAKNHGVTKPTARMCTSFITIKQKATAKARRARRQTRSNSVPIPFFAAAFALFAPSRLHFHLLLHRRRACRQELTERHVQTLATAESLEINVHPA